MATEGEPRFAAVGGEGDEARGGHIQDMSLFAGGAHPETWGWAGVEIPRRWSPAEVVYGTELVRGEAAIVVTCREEDRAALLPYLAATLNAWAARPRGETPYAQLEPVRATLRAALTGGPLSPGDLLGHAARRGHRDADARAALWYEIDAGRIRITDAFDLALAGDDKE